MNISCFILKRCSNQALDLQGAEGEETLGHLLIGEVRHDEAIRQQWTGALGE